MIIQQKYCCAKEAFLKEWTNEQSRKLRYKRSDLSLTGNELCKILKIGTHTLKKLESGECIIKQSVYIKVLEWLTKDY